MNSNINIIMTLKALHLILFPANTHFIYLLCAQCARVMNSLISLDLMGLMFLYIGCFENQENKILA